MADRRRGEPPIQEDLAFQRREWRVQRAGWFALMGFVIAAALGAFGGGPLSHARAGDPGSALSIEYERFLRRHATERISIHLAPASATRQALEIRVSRTFIDDLRVEHMMPAPDSIESGPAEAVLRFSGASARTRVIVLDAQPLAVGWRRATVATAGAPPVSITQFVYF
jgi:hypothetical protein